MDLTQVLHIGVECLVLVKVLMNLRVPQYVLKLLNI